MVYAILTLLAIGFLSSIGGQFIVTPVLNLVAATSVLGGGVLFMMFSRRMRHVEYEEIGGVTLDSGRAAGARDTPVVAPLVTASPPVASVGTNRTREELDRLRRTVIEAVPDREIDWADTMDIGSRIASIAAASHPLLRTLEGQIAQITDQRIPGREPTNTEASSRLKPPDVKELRALVLALEELADLSNILAINGAIEAARIGKAGRGFAVIAGQMQSFAAQSAELSRGMRRYGEGQTTQRVERTAETQRFERVRERERQLEDELARINNVARGAADTVMGLAESFNLYNLQKIAEAIEQRGVDSKAMLRDLKELRLFAENTGSDE
jgi:hypothetical protein